MCRIILEYEMKPKISRHELAKIATDNSKRLINLMAKAHKDAGKSTLIFGGGRCLA